MSYGAYGKQATRYREMEVMSASPAQLVVIVFDHLLASLRRARVAMDAGDAALRGEHLARGRAALGELLATLDRERGGEVAGNLAALYAFYLTELVDLGIHPSTARLDRVTRALAEIRDAFAQVAGSPAGQAFVAASASA